MPSWERVLLISCTISAAVLYFVEPVRVLGLSIIQPHPVMTPEQLESMVRTLMPPPAKTVDEAQIELMIRRAIAEAMSLLKTTTPTPAPGPQTTSLPPVTAAPEASHWELPVVMLTYELFIVLTTLIVLATIYGLWRLISAWRNYGSGPMILVNESFRAGSDYQEIPLTTVQRSIFGIFSKNFLGSYTYVGTGFRMGDYVYTASHVLKAAASLKGEIWLRLGDRCVKSPVWVPIYDDVVAAPYEAVATLEMSAFKPGQAACDYSTVVLSATPGPNSSMGLLHFHSGDATYRYTGSTRPGFSGSPILSTLGSGTRVLAMHLSGGVQNLCVSTMFLHLLTRRGLVSWEKRSAPQVEPESSGFLEDDSATKILNSFRKNKAEVKLNRRTNDEVFVTIQGLHYAMDTEVYDNWFNDSVARSAHLEAIEIPKNGVEGCSPSSMVDSLTTCPTTSINPTDVFQFQQDTLTQSPLVTQFNDLSKAISGLHVLLEKCVSRPVLESVNLSSPSQPRPMASRKSKTSPSTTTPSQPPCADLIYKAARALDKAATTLRSAKLSDLTASTSQQAQSPGDALSGSGCDSN